MRKLDRLLSRVLVALGIVFICASQTGVSRACGDSPSCVGGELSYL
jgi:hypothetical protein